MTTDKLGGRKTLAVEGFLEEFEKDEIKRQVDIVSLFESFGVKLTAKGKGFAGQCPWHPDKEPSLSVDREKGLYHCFGCGESGDVVTLVEKQRSLGFREALEYLKAQAGRMAQVSARDGRRMPRTSAAHPVAIAADVGRILDDVAARYATDFASHQEARAYLASRGLDSAELITRFKFGFCTGSLSDSLSKAQKAALSEIGLVKASGVEHFAGCITFPLFDESGHVVGFYGRRASANSGPSHLYLPGPHRGLFNREAAKVYREKLILTESVIDALSLVAMGIQNVIPCYGVNGFTEEHRKLLHDERVQGVVVAFDSDEAGSTASAKLAQELQAQGLDVAELRPPLVKDWNEYLTANGSGEGVIALLKDLTLRRGAESETLQMSSDGSRQLARIGDRRYRILGARELSFASLRVNVRAECGVAKYIDNVDLYSARSRASFANSFAAASAQEASRIERDLVAILEHLEAQRERELAATEEAQHVLTASEREAGMQLLTDPKLFDRIIHDTEVLGYVGEEVNKLLVYLAATSRKTDDPMSVLVLSESAAGKSYLIETVKRLMPPEEVVSMTSLSDQALNYMNDEGLLHKFLVMGEAVHGEIVEHQIREMLSEKELSRLVTLKDPKTGELSTRTVRKRVVVSCVMSSTNSQLNPENVSRFFVVNADESQEQTARIHKLQRRKYSLERYREQGEEIPRIIGSHHAAQRLLKSRVIVNPFAQALSFPDSLMRTRRDHERFLDLIAAVCFLRQFQKEEREQPGPSAEPLHYLECDLTDYEIAHGIMSGIMGATLSGVPAGVVMLYERLRKLARAKAKESGLEAHEVGFTQRELRESGGLSAMTIKRALRLLTDYEYVILEGSRLRGARRGYRLIADEPLELIDRTSLPSPQEMAAKLQTLESGAEWVKSGSAPLLEG